MDELLDAGDIFAGSGKDKLTHNHIQVTEEIVRKQFDKIRSDKAAGADDISPKFLSELTLMSCNVDHGNILGDWGSPRRFEIGEYNSNF